MPEPDPPLRILVVTVGSSGDVHPFVAIASVLRDRGHDVTVQVNPYFESTVRGAGLDYRALGSYLSPTDVARDNPAAFRRYTGTYVVMRSLFMEGFREAYPSLRAAFEEIRPDVVVGHQISFGLPWLAREFGAAWVTCVLSPSTLISNHDPSVYPFGMDARNKPMWMRRVHHVGAQLMTSMILDPPMNRFRKSIGVAPARNILFDEMLSADRVLAMFSPHFRAPAPDDPERLLVCGFPWFERHGGHAELGERLTPETERFLDAGDPPIVFSLGSVLSHTQVDAFHAALEAARLVGRRAILVTGHAHDDALDLGDDALRLDYAPYSLLMSRAAANVHHGGIGTTAQALRAGRPMIVVPHAHDQFDNAARAEAKGVGLGLRPGRRLSARRLSIALETVLGSAPMREAAARMGRAIAEEDGALIAADEIEALVARPGTGPGAGPTR